MQESPARLTFDRFVFEPTSGELAAPDGTIRLQPQAAMVLRLLLERAGAVVTRDELRAKLWPDTTVEFDQGLNFCVRQLRIALGDDAGTPRFIETLPRRGYRFIPPVTEVPRGPRSEQRGIPRRRGYPVAIAIVAALLGSSWGISRAAYHPGSASTPATLAILPFDLEGSDSALVRYQHELAEDLVTRVTRAEPARISVLGPTSTARFEGTKTSLGTLSKEIGATHVLSGTLRNGPGGVAVFAQLIRIADGRHVWAGRFVDSTGRAARDSSVAARVAAGTARTLR